MLQAASRLYAVIPLTGGKVGAVNLWRKSLEETLAFGWEAFYSLRTTFPLPGTMSNHSYRILFNQFLGQNIIRPVSVDEPQRAIPLNQDRLRCSIVTLCNLFGYVFDNVYIALLMIFCSSPVQRPVQLPLGNLMRFVTSLMSCSTDGVVGFLSFSFLVRLISNEYSQNDGFIDPLVRSMELSIVPEVRTMGCELLEYLAQQSVAGQLPDPFIKRSRRFSGRLDPYAGRLLSILVSLLEENPDM